MVGRYDADRVCRGGRRQEQGGPNVSMLVSEAGQAARVNDLADGGGAVTVTARQAGMRSSAGPRSASRADCGA